MASVKQTLIDRITGTLDALKAISVEKDVNEAKKGIGENLRKSTTKFGRVADNLEETMPIVKALWEETKAIKRVDFEEQAAYVSAVASHRDNSITAVENLLEAIKALPDDIGEKDSTTGGLGERTTFLMKLYKIDGEGKRTGEELAMKSGEIAKSFLGTPRAKECAESKENTLATAIRKHFKEDLQLEWDEPEKGADKIFYKLYRLIRPTLMRGFEKIRNGEDPLAKKTPEKPAEEAPAAEAQ